MRDIWRVAMTAGHDRGAKSHKDRHYAMPAQNGFHVVARCLVFNEGIRKDHYIPHSHQRTGLLFGNVNKDRTRLGPRRGHPLQTAISEMRQWRGERSISPLGQMTLFANMRKAVTKRGHAPQIQDKHC